MMDKVTLPSLAKDVAGLRAEIEKLDKSLRADVEKVEERLRWLGRLVLSSTAAIIVSVLAAVILRGGI